MEGGVYTNRVIYPELSYNIVRVLFSVNNKLGFGYKARHYQRALEISFREAGVNFISQ